MRMRATYGMGPATPARATRFAGFFGRLGGSGASAEPLPRPRNSQNPLPVGRPRLLPNTMTLVLAATLAATLAGLAKTLLLTLIAVLNGVLALLAALATWKTYLAIGTKVFLIVLFCIPVVGLLVFLVWGQRVVRDNQR